jgi:hypothetical protein
VPPNSAASPRLGLGLVRVRPPGVAAILCRNAAPLIDHRCTETLGPNQRTDPIIPG